MFLGLDILRQAQSDMLLYFEFIEVETEDSS